MSQQMNLNKSKLTYSIDSNIRWNCTDRDSILITDKLSECYNSRTRGGVPWLQGFDLTPLTKITVVRCHFFFLLYLFREVL